MSTTLDVNNLFHIILMEEVCMETDEKKEKVEAMCGPCRGTGVFRGYQEPKGVGKACYDCGGTGKRIIKYIPFTERQICHDIKTVRFTVDSEESHRGFVEISYDDFLAGKWPPQK